MKYSQHFCFGFPICRSLSKPDPLKFKFCTILHPRKNYGLGKIAESIFRQIIYAPTVSLHVLGFRYVHAF